MMGAAAAADRPGGRGEWMRGAAPPADRPAARSHRMRSRRLAPWRRARSMAIWSFVPITGCRLVVMPAPCLSADRSKPAPLYDAHDDAVTAGDMAAIPRLAIRWAYIVGPSSGSAPAIPCNLSHKPIATPNSRLYVARM